MAAKYKAIDIANFYIQLVNSLPDNTIDNLKLNKLLYYAQGWSLNRLGKPLFDDEIQAWDYGPVIPDVYHTFKKYGSKCIRKPIAEFDENVLESDELELLVDVYTNYGKYTGWALKDMTHVKGSPWDKVYVKGENHVISINSIQGYFKKRKLSSFEPDKLNIPVITAIPDSWDSAGDTVYG